jgi:hypothetical protein
MSDEHTIFDPAAGMTVDTGIMVASQLYGKDAATQIAWLAIIARSEDLKDKFRFLVKVFKRLTNTPDEFMQKLNGIREPNLSVIAVNSGQQGPVGIVVDVSEMVDHRTGHHREQEGKNEDAEGGIGNHR